MGIRHVVPAGLPTGAVAGKVAGDDWRGDHLHVPYQVTLFHGGAAGVYTAPLAATNAEAATAPMSRAMIDLSQASQFRFVVGMRTAGVGYTTALLRPQFSTDQTTWAELAATAAQGDVSVLAGANQVNAAAWASIAAAAKVDNVFLRLLFVSTGTGTTAASVSWADLLFR